MKYAIVMNRKKYERPINFPIIILLIFILHKLMLCKNLRLRYSFDDLCTCSELMFNS